MTWVCGACGLKCYEAEKRCPACDARERRMLWEFFDAWTAREHETTDFDLHAATVERFEKAHDALTAFRETVASD